MCGAKNEKKSEMTLPGDDEISDYFTHCSFYLHFNKCLLNSTLNYARWSPHRFEKLCGLGITSLNDCCGPKTLPSFVRLINIYRWISISKKSKKHSKDFNDNEGRIGFLVRFHLHGLERYRPVACARNFIAKSLMNQQFASFLRKLIFVACAARKKRSQTENDVKLISLERLMSQSSWFTRLDVNVASIRALITQNRFVQR